MKKLFCALVIALVSCSAYAEDYLTINGFSKHVNSSVQHNERNQGLGYARDVHWSWLGDVQPQIGFYRNSEYGWTEYAFLTKYFASFNDNQLRFGGTAGVAFGYLHTPIMPVAALVANVNTKPVGLNLLLTAYRDAGDGSTNVSSGKAKPLIALQFVIPLDIK